MVGPPAAAALLLLVPIYTTEGATLPLSSPMEHIVRGNRRIGHVLRGQLENAHVRTSRNILKSTSAATGHLALLDKCYMTDDCAPGLFMEADFRTQCETTPFFGDDAICCKPFATPCDSNEACCSGNCNTKHTRCDDIVAHAPPYNQQHDDHYYDDTQNDDGQYDDAEIDDGQYDDQYDDGWYDDGQYDDGQHYDSRYDGGQYEEDDQLDDGRYDEAMYDDGLDDYGEFGDDQHDDGQYDDGQDDGQHDDAHYDDGRYDDGQYVDGQHDDAGYDDGQYDDSEHEESIATDNTGGNPALTSSAPDTDPISDPSVPNSADSSDYAENDRHGPPMKIDPDGPYAHGRSYSDYDDDHYHGYSRSGGEGQESGSTQPAPHNPLDESGSDEGGSSEPPLQHPPPPRDGDDAPPTLPVDKDDNAAPSCVPDYSSGTMETTASSSEEKIQVVTMDSQGNTFYTLSYGHGAADTIRRAAPSASDTAVGGPEHGEDALVYTGTGVILAMTVDADDNLVFSMEDAPAVSGGVFMLQMGPGGVLLLQDEGGELGGGGEASFDDTTAPALLLAGGLGPFLPGVAVCPVSEDIYVSRGHTGIARLVKDADGSFGTKVEWDMKDMAFDDTGTTRAPLMIWGIAVNSQGIVYLTTYVQGVVLKAILPKNGGSANVRLAAGSWNSGVTASSGDGRKAVSAAMAYPKGLAIDVDDAVYVAEFQGEKIRRVSTTGMISTVAGTGSTVYGGDGGPASEAGLDLPNAIAFAPGKSGSKMAIADFGHSVVRVIAPVSLCA